MSSARYVRCICEIECMICMIFQHFTMYRYTRRTRIPIIFVEFFVHMCACNDNAGCENVMYVHYVTRSTQDDVACEHVINMMLALGVFQR